jgi:hypothetical protein
MANEELVSVTVTPDGNGQTQGSAEPSFPARRGKLIRLPMPPAAPEQCILAVWFRSPDGRRWQAVGGGATVAEAITCAVESCPDNTTWHPVRWNDLYGG